MHNGIYIHTFTCGTKVTYLKQQHFFTVPAVRIVNLSAIGALAVFFLCQCFELRKLVKRIITILRKYI